MTVNLIVAMADNGVIGYKGGIPWRLNRDLKHFKELTLNHNVIMGKRTFESIGKPLDNRTNFVVSRTIKLTDKQIKEPLLMTAKDLKSAIIPYMTNFIIGGAQLYAEALPLCDVIYLTRIHLEPKGDVFFPHFEHRFNIVDAVGFEENGITGTFEIWRQKARNEIN